MLKPEVAKQQLKQWELDDGIEKMVAKCATLPIKLRRVAHALINCDEHGKTIRYSQLGYLERVQAQAEQKAVFSSLSKNDRAKLFKVLFGDLAQSVELTMVHLLKGPYQQSYMRRGFRAPGRPAATLNLRFGWIERFVRLSIDYQPVLLTPEMLAAWAPYLSYGSMSGEIGQLLAAVIDAGGKQADAVYEILYQSATNEHEVGCMGRHITTALLGASREEGWAFMEKLLLAAQRQEGLRQAVLEAIDFAQPEAFRRMLRIIVDEKLARFSAVARAVDVWLGLQWDSASVTTINKGCERLLSLLESEKVRQQALASKSAEDAYFALWAIGYEDVEKSIPAAEKLAKHRAPEHRFVAAYHLQQTDFCEAQATLVALLEDDDLRVAMQALSAVQVRQGETKAETLRLQEEVFSAVERLMQRIPDKKFKLPEIVWPWTAREFDRSDIAAKMVNCIGDLPPSKLIPYLAEFDPRNRSRACSHLASQEKWDNETRSTLVSLIGDASQDVRSSALSAFEKKPLVAVEAERVEGFLTRSASDLRQGAVRLLLAQPDKAAAASAERLIASKHANQRLAGLELMKELAEADRERSRCVKMAVQFQESQKRISKDETTQLQSILASGAEKLTLDNGLGLFDPAERTPRMVPKKRKTPAFTKAALKLLVSLDNLVDQHKADPIRSTNWRGDVVETPLGGLTYGLPVSSFDKPADQQIEKFHFSELWLKWNANRPASERDADGGELLRAYCLLELVDGYGWERDQKWLKKRDELAKFVFGGLEVPDLQYSSVVLSVLQWLLRLQPDAKHIGIAADVCESLLALIPHEEHQKLVEMRSSGSPRQRYGYFYGERETNDWREVSFYDSWLHSVRRQITDAAIAGDELKSALQRYWQLSCWIDEPVHGAARKRTGLDDRLLCYSYQLATLADVMDDLIGPDIAQFSSLSTLTKPRHSPELATFLKSFPEVGQAVEGIRSRVLDIELSRGDLPTPATTAADAVESFFGIDTLVRIVSTIGKERFKPVQYSWRPKAKIESLTALAKACHPAPGETNSQFQQKIKAAVKAGAFGEEKVMQLAFLAPQWTQMVKEYYGWDGLDEGLYWFLAHMQFVSGGEEAAIAAGVDADGSTADKDTELGEAAGENTAKAPKLSAWQRLVLERTPLSEAERGNGVVDVAWFHRTFATLGRKKWEALAEASRFAATSAQAKRAQYIADVLLGVAKKSDLVAQIRDRKLKEHVRLLGLLPLATGAKRDADLQDRYKILQEYKKYAKGLSSLSKPGAELAADIGLQNLSQLAGFDDPLRLEWAMEAEATQDLLKGPIVVSKDDVAMTLQLDDRAQPVVSIERGGKPLKTLPKTHKDLPAFSELADRSRELKRQASRVRGSLEAAMLRGDEFTGIELSQIARHALLKPMLERLVVVGEGTLGYPDKQGKAIRSFDGTLEPVKKSEKFRIAHTWDLFAAKNLDKWQHECFQAERLQPFKQVFRELYVVTKQEKADGHRSRRYAGQQVNPQQAYALWGQRGWNVDEGVFKVFHGLGINATVDFNYGSFTPLEVEGLTIESVQFYSSDHQLLELSKVPPRIFSEVMRDLDLVVSVAHRGGVDPEASASTVEMRSALLQETCDLLGIKNVKLNKSHVVIKGFLSDYTVHLGSAVVHRLPGGAVCLVPVHAQHRGRLFLPFADDDPKTAEVISKTLLLAKDKEIQDPSILEQLQA